MNWISIAVDALSYACEHKKEIAHGAETAIHVLRRIEHQIVKHNTTADHLLVVADKALHEYNQQEKEKEESGNG